MAEPSDPAQPPTRAGWLALPGLALITALVAAPCLVLALVAFLGRGDAGELVWRLTTGNVVRLAGFGIHGWSPSRLWIRLRTLLLAGIGSAAAMALAYPVCRLIACASPRLRLLLIAAVAIPCCTNLVVRTYGWVVLCSSHLPLAWLAQQLGLIAPNRALTPSLAAEVIGMCAALLPFAILPLYPSVAAIDQALIDAARDLGASQLGILRHAILPQIRAGLWAAFVLTAVPATGMFLIGDLLGGDKHMLLGNAIQQAFFTSNDLPFGAALSCVLTALTVLTLLWARRLGLRAAAS